MDIFAGHFEKGLVKPFLVTIVYCDDLTRHCHEGIAFLRQVYRISAIRSREAFFPRL
jgi:hypothetical protein